MDFRPESVRKALKEQMIAQNKTRRWSHYHYHERARFDGCLRQTTCQELKMKDSLSSSRRFLENDWKDYINVDYSCDFRPEKKEFLYGEWNSNRQFKHNDNYWHNENRRLKIKSAMEHRYTPSIKKFFGSDYDLKTGMDEYEILNVTNNDNTGNVSVGVRSLTATRQFAEKAGKRPQTAEELLLSRLLMQKNVDIIS